MSAIQLMRKVLETTIKEGNLPDGLLQAVFDGSDISQDRLTFNTIKRLGQYIKKKKIQFRMCDTPW